MSLPQSVTNAKAAQHAATSTPVLDSGGDGQLHQTERCPRVSEQIAVAVADGNLLQSTHHGFLDVPGHGAMIAHVFPQLRGSLLSISKLIKLRFQGDVLLGFRYGIRQARQASFPGT